MKQNSSTRRRLFALLIGLAGSATAAERSAPDLLLPSKVTRVTDAKPLALVAPASSWDLSDFESLLVKVRNDSNASATVWARAENAGATGLQDTVRNAVDLSPNEEATLRLRLTRR